MVCCKVDGKSSEVESEKILVDWVDSIIETDWIDVDSSLRIPSGLKERFCGYYRGVALLYDNCIACAKLKSRTPVGVNWRYALFTRESVIPVRVFKTARQLWQAVSSFGEHIHSRIRQTGRVDARHL